MSLLKNSVVALTILTGFPPSAIAHDVHRVSSAALHILSNGEHFSGFFFLGILTGLFASLAGSRRRSVGLCMAAIPFFLLSSGSHVSLVEPGGIIFAVGFLSTGFLIMFVAGNAAIRVLHDTDANEKSVKKD